MSRQPDLRDHRPAATGPRVRHRPGAAFLLLAAAVIVAAVTVRVASLGRQSYWVDELFSVHESAGSLHRLLAIGATEVHPPLYAVLLWLWMKIGGLHEAWTRSLSTLFALAAVLVAHHGLRTPRLDSQVRWALTVATAAGGTSIVYSLDTRSYALLLLGATGLTAATVRAAIVTVDREPLPGRLRASWFGWALLAATTHLFGAVLALAGFGVLTALTAFTAPAGTGGRTRGSPWLRESLTTAAITAAACGPQAAWIIAGVRRPGFAADTDWIKPPGPRDVWELASTTFAAGPLSTQKDGFAWAGPRGVLAALALVALAGGYGLWSARRAPGGSPDPAPDAPPKTAEGTAALVLIALAAAVIVPTYALSQVEHLWTLRNLAVVSPALLWGVICLAAAAARTGVGRRAVATGAVVLLGAGLIPIGQGLSQPYKQDFRSLFRYLAQARAEQPDVQIFFTGRGPAWGWQPSTDPGRDDPAYHLLYQDIGVRAVRTREVVRTGGPQIVVRYPGVAPKHFDEQVRTMMIRLGSTGCRPVPIHDLVVVRCR